MSNILLEIRSSETFKNLPFTVIRRKSVCGDDQYRQANEQCYNVYSLMHSAGERNKAIPVKDGLPNDTLRHRKNKLKLSYEKETYDLKF